MRTIIMVSCLVLSFTACKNANKDQSIDRKTTQEDYIEAKEDISTTTQDQPVNRARERSKEENVVENTQPNGSKNTTSSRQISGTYIHTDHLADGDCSCYCIDVQMDGTSELCLSENELYINGRFEKSGNNINIYYSGKSARTDNSELPWDKFEKNTPIAVLTPSGNAFELDWKGFSINGEIAVDYALYGKKTLEGTYKKK